MNDKIIAEKRLEWAKHLQKENEKLKSEIKELLEWIAKLQRFQTMVGDYHLEAFIDAWDKVETGHKTKLECEEE